MTKKILMAASCLLASVAFAQDASSVAEFANKHSDKITAVGKAALNAKQNGTSVTEAATQALTEPPKPADPVESLKDKAKAAAFGSLFK